MKILFTGMSSSHCKPSKVSGYFNSLAKLVGEVAEVSWAIPSTTWTSKHLDKYDYVFVGVTPPTSLSANKAYGGLHIIDLLWDSPKLRLVLDSPQVWQYKNSIRKAANDPSNGLFSSFYSLRWEYQAAKEIKSVSEAVKKLSIKKWPTTIYPGLPWKSDESAALAVGLDVSSSLVALNLDAINLVDPIYSDNRQPFWSVDDSKLSWARKLVGTIKYETVDVRSKRGYSDEDAAGTISDSIGLIIPPQDRKVGTWWSYRYVQGLNTATPIVTNWLETKGFSSSWAKLAYQVEDMSPEDRLTLAEEQRRVYVDSIPSRDELIELISTKIFSKNVGEYTNA